MRPNCASKWVIRKNGYFYRPNFCGYTSAVGEAGLYTEVQAKHAAAMAQGVTAHPLTDFTEPVKFQPPAVTAEAVRIFRDATGSGMMEAKLRLRQQGYEAAMNEFRAHASLEDKVDFILDWITDAEMKR